MKSIAGRRGALQSRGIGLTAGVATLATRPAAARAAEACSLIPVGVRSLRDLTMRLSAAPRRRSFKTVPMILTDEDQWDHEALSEVLACQPPTKPACDMNDTAQHARKMKKLKMSMAIPVLGASMAALAACTGSPAILASPPGFEVSTPAGMASVSIRESPPGITDAEFLRTVKAAMEQAAPGDVIADPVEQPFPSLRIVWHAEPTTSRGTVRVIANVFNGPTPYAYEQQVIGNGAPGSVMSSAVESVATRLLAVVDAHGKAAT